VGKDRVVGNATTEQLAALIGFGLTRTAPEPFRVA